MGNVCRGPVHRSAIEFLGELPSACLSNTFAWYRRELRGQYRRANDRCVGPAADNTVRGTRPRWNTLDKTCLWGGRRGLSGVWDCPGLELLIARAPKGRTAGIDDVVKENSTRNRNTIEKRLRLLFAAYWL